MAASTPVPHGRLDAALEHVEHGGRLVVRTVTRTTVITRRTLLSFRRSGYWLLKETDDGGFRLRSGKGSVYLFPGQLQAIDAGHEAVATETPR